MSISRRELFQQLPRKDVLRSLGQIASSLGLGQLVQDDADAPGAVEAAGLALGRRKAAGDWLESLTRQSAAAGASGAARDSENPGQEVRTAGAEPRNPGESQGD